MVGWFDRVRKANAGQRVSRADVDQARAAVAELAALNAERDRLTRDGLPGVATIVAIRRDVATTTLGQWHELDLEVRLPDFDPYRATRRIALELTTAPHVKVGAQVPVRVDQRDHSIVLVVATLPG
ncbi:hypothetical protein [Mycobacterium kubicae]|uniref:hypothetical protein n=1 Tax=Mycobacterium kubicae TaxID=120959 RepID=UPI000AADCDC9|nr:hypothetical protein [Mycobacterium kubicae]